MLNYLYYPVLGRLLPLHAFGEVQVLFSILLDIVVFFAALSIVITNITANAGKVFHKSNIIELEQATLVILYGLFIIWLISAPMISRFLKIDGVWPVITIYSVIMISLIINTRQAFLQGRQDFWGVTVGTLLGAGMKLVFSALLVVLGFGVIGAIAGLAIGQLINAIYATYRCRKQGLNFPVLKIHFDGFSRILPELRHVLPALAVSLSISVLYSSDIIVIKHFFSPNVAGQYAGVAAIGRIIFFLTGPISLVMFSSVKLANTTKHNLMLLRRSIFLLLAIGGLVAMFCGLFPRFAVSLLLGNKYLPAAQYLPSLAIALLLVTLANILLYFDLALRLKRSAAISIAGLILIVVLAVNNHHTINQVITNISYVTIVMIAASLAMHLRDLGIKKEAKVG
ncbi:MAG: hypothetical protein NVS1B10_07230 [Candidatus Saccharimonadales bacterium]